MSPAQVLAGAVAEQGAPPADVPVQMILLCKPVKMLSRWGKVNDSLSVRSLHVSA
jgi:hypothetical protein